MVTQNLSQYKINSPPFTAVDSLYFACTHWWIHHGQHEVHYLVQGHLKNIRRIQGSIQFCWKSQRSRTWWEWEEKNFPVSRKETATTDWKVRGGGKPQRQEQELPHFLLKVLRNTWHFLEATIGKVSFYEGLQEHHFGGKCGLERSRSSCLNG